MNAVIDRNRDMKRNTYLLCADAEKCFDNLWLEDCLVDMNRSGMREREIIMLQRLNREARVVVETPCGDAEEFQVRNIVKQGTIFGPLLCCCNTAMIEEIGTQATTFISPNMEIASLTYVDDILAGGSPEMIEEVGKKLAIMEKEKIYTFNSEKNELCGSEDRERKRKRIGHRSEEGENKTNRKIQNFGKLDGRKLKTSGTNK